MKNFIVPVLMASSGGMASGFMTQNMISGRKDLKLSEQNSNEEPSKEDSYFMPRYSDAELKKMADDIVKLDEIYQESFNKDFNNTAFLEEFDREFESMPNPYRKKEQNKEPSKDNENDQKYFIKPPSDDELEEIYNTMYSIEMLNQKAFEKQFNRTAFIEKFDKEFGEELSTVSGDANRAVDKNNITFVESLDNSKNVTNDKGFSR